VTHEHDHTDQITRMRTSHRTTEKPSAFRSLAQDTF
jgi:hypothetical protein